MLDNELFPVEREMPNLHLAVSGDECTGLLWKSGDTKQPLMSNSADYLPRPAGISRSTETICFLAF